MRQIALTSLLFFVIFYNSIEPSSQTDKTPSNQEIPNVNEPPPVRRRRPQARRESSRESEISNARTPCVRNQRHRDNILMPDDVVDSELRQQFPHLFQEGPSNRAGEFSSPENSESSRRYFRPEVQPDVRHASQRESNNRHRIPPNRYARVNAPVNPPDHHAGQSPGHSSSGSNSDMEP